MKHLLLNHIKEKVKDIESFVPCTLVFTHYVDTIESDIWLQLDSHDERVGFGSSIILNRK